jgi:hypothetical protein
MTPAESWDRIRQAFLEPEAVNLTKLEREVLGEVGSPEQIFHPGNTRFEADKTRYFGVFKRRALGEVAEHRPLEERVYVSQGTYERALHHCGPLGDHEVFRPTRANLDALVAETDFGPYSVHPELIDLLMDIGGEEE